MAMQAVVAREDRTSKSGVTVSPLTLGAVVSARLLNPTASQEVIAQLVGCDPWTVSHALSTKYAQSRLSSWDMAGAVRDNVGYAIGDAISLARKALVRGHRELDKDEPNPVALNASTTYAQLALKASVFAERVVQEHQVRGAQDYAALQALKASIGEPESPMPLAHEERRGSSPTIPPDSGNSEDGV